MGYYGGESLIRGHTYTETKSEETTTTYVVRIRGYIYQVVKNKKKCLHRK